MPKPNSLARGTPPPHVQERREGRGISLLYDRIFDGRIWEIAPADHGLKPRRAYQTLRQYAASKHLSVLAAKRGHLLYVQNLDSSNRDPDDTTVYALNGREPERKRWISLGSTEPDDDGSDPDPEDETPAEPKAAITPSPRQVKSRPRDPDRPRRESRKYVPAKRLEPYVLQCMNEYFENSLINTEILRVVDALVAATEETRLVDHNQVRLCLAYLVDDPDTLLFRREATQQERYEMGATGAKTFLYSPTHPVPTWNAGLHNIIEEKYPVPRANAFVRSTPRAAAPLPPKLPLADEVAAQIPVGRIVDPERVVVEQPKYRVTTRDPEPDKVVINGSTSFLGERAQKALLELTALLVEAEHPHELENLRGEVATLREQVTALTAERDKAITDRDSAVDQLRAVAEAQRTLAQLLGAANPGS